MEVVNGLLRGTLELKRGELILRALNTAVRNIRRVRFDLHQDEMIREIPNYPDQPLTDIDEPYEPSAAPRRPPTREEVARFREADPGRILRRPRQSPRSLQASTPRQCPRERNGTEAHLNPCRDGRIRPSRFCRDSFRGGRGGLVGDSRPRLSRRPSRDRFLGPKLRRSERMQPTAQAVGKRGKKEPAPAGRKKTRRLDKPEPQDSRRRLSPHDAEAG